MRQRQLFLCKHSIANSWRRVWEAPSWREQGKVQSLMGRTGIWTVWDGGFPENAVCCAHTADGLDVGGGALQQHSPIQASFCFITTRCYNSLTFYLLGNLIDKNHQGYRHAFHRLHQHKYIHHSVSTFSVSIWPWLLRRAPAVILTKWVKAVWLPNQIW